MDIEDIVEALRAIGCSHIQVVACDHHNDCIEVALKFLVKHNILAEIDPELEIDKATPLMPIISAKH